MEVIIKSENEYPKDNLGGIVGAYNQGVSRSWHLTSTSLNVTATHVLLVVGKPLVLPE